GYYVKDERTKQFAYSFHAAADRNGFVLGTIVTPENYTEVLDEAILDESFNSFIFFYCYNSHFLSSADEYLLSEHL
ncbi:hypothetical protein ACIGC1_21520, partial [Peribacillus butanolivorans]|uniref:hypothetical protein n=1 Tax=Peribacillus butanolivorans TaxID=421767 RepID=UPI0037CBD080